MMTRLTRINFRCESCNAAYGAIVPVSINAWMDPSSIERFLNEGLAKECPECHHN